MSIIKYIIDWLRRLTKKVIIGVVTALVAVPAVVVTVPLLPPNAVTIQEYQAIVQMYDAELPHIMGEPLKVSGGDIFASINTEIRERGISQETELLIQKAEDAMNKKSLLDVIID